MCDLSSEFWSGIFQSAGPAEGPEALFAAADIPESFLDQLRSCAGTFKKYQMEAIKENLWLYPHMSGQERHRLTQVRECCRQAYVERYAVRSIRRADKICSDSSKVDCQGGKKYGGWIEHRGGQLVQFLFDG